MYKQLNTFGAGQASRRHVVSDTTVAGVLALRVPGSQNRGLSEHQSIAEVLEVYSCRGDERLCHAWPAGGNRANIIDRFIEAATT